MSITIRNAGQLLRPVEGVPYKPAFSSKPGELAIREGLIATFEDDPEAETIIDANGGAVIPGFVDCHTHLPFVGWRAGEYEMKVTGVPYEEISRSGGGIASSARMLAESSDEQVLAQARAIRVEMLRLGTTTVEGKTGYGLSIEAERRLVDLGRALPLDRVTGLFAHSVPPNHTPATWMDDVDDLAKLTEVDALDIYVESVAFRNEDLARLGEIAKREHVSLRAHVEQFATHRSVPVALEAGARSVDHLACIDPDDIAPLARAECAAVLLPGAEFLGNEKTPPARELLDAGAICVLATDCNPGTSPVASMPLVIGLAVRRYGWSVREALAAATLNAAWVLQFTDRGSLEIGKRADVLILDGPVEHLPYRFGHDPVVTVIRDGEVVWQRP